MSTEQTKVELSIPQKSIFYLEKYVGKTISVICGRMLIKGNQNQEKMIGAINEIFRLNDALRLRIIEEQGTLYQYVARFKRQEIKILTFTNERELDIYASEYAKERIALDEDLCEIAIIQIPEHYGIMVKMHHIIGDAWTSSLICTQFNKLLSGETIKNCSYVEYINTENEYLKSKKYQNDKQFFMNQQKIFGEKTVLKVGMSENFSAKRKTFLVKKETTNEINKYTSEKNVSVFGLFMTILAIYINRITMNSENIYIGTSVLNRKSRKEKHTMGMFVNTVPILNKLANNESFFDNLIRVQNELFATFRHQKYNYIEMASEYMDKPYDIMLDYQNAMIAGADVNSKWYHNGIQSEDIQIHLEDRDDKGILRIHYDYLVDKYEEVEVERMHSHIINLLSDAILNDSKKIYELRLLSLDEEQEILKYSSRI